MEKLVNVSEIRQSLDTFLEAVRDKDDTILIEEKEQPVAVVVPIGIYWQWLRGQELLKDKIREIAAQDGLSEEEAEINELIEQAKWWIRLERKSDES